MAPGTTTPLVEPKSRASVRSPSAQVEKIRRILVCLDRSLLAEACLPCAVALAQTFGSKLTLVNVMEPPRDGRGRATTDALGWEIARQEAASYLERMQTGASRAAGHVVDVKLEQGRAGERIPAFAKEMGADLTVLGSHGEGGASAFTLGTTVQQVLAGSCGSVLVARSTSRSPAPFSPTKILVPLDGSARTESVLPTAARLAKVHDAQLLLVHVVPEPAPTALLRTVGGLELAKELATRLEGGATSYLEQLREQWAGEVTRVRALVMRHPDPRLCLTEVARSEGVDLAVLSAHGSTCNPMEPFGAVAMHLLTHLPLPLLVLQDVPANGHGTVIANKGVTSPPLRARFTPEGA